MIQSKEYYLNTFSIGEEDLEKLTEAALEGGGGDYADLYFEKSSYDEISLQDSIVNRIASDIDYGCGIRTLIGEKTGYAYSDDTSMRALMATARTAGAIARGENRADAIPTSPSNRYFGKPNPAADRYPVKMSWEEKKCSQLIDVLTKLESLIRAKDPRATKINASLSYSTSDILMYNSFGELKYESRPMVSLGASAVFVKDGQQQMQHTSRSYRMGAEFLTDEILQEVASQCTDGIDNLFEAKRPKGGKMPVVMGAGASGILLHEAIGHSFEADFNRKGQSIFSEKMGQKICSDKITVVDDATIHGNRGSLNFDDEGVPGQRTVMVENGVLASYLHDRVSAAYYGVAPTGNGRRESYRYHPIPRMRCTYMENGSDGSAQDIISSVKKGIYVDKFSNGEVNIGQGDFTFYVKSGFLIENGHLTAPIKDLNIIGNGPKALADIIAVGSDLKIDDSRWICGKEQSAPVTCGIPTVLVKGLVVGGE